MTKAERIFKETRWECKQHIQTWGYKENPNGKAVGICGLITGNDGFTSTRTHNAIQNIIDIRRDGLKHDMELGIITHPRFNDEMMVLNMVQSTLDNEIERYKKWH
jgi:hypothetical protein